MENNFATVFFLRPYGTFFVGGIHNIPGVKTPGWVLDAPAGLLR
jgi:hypothetical protein